jgi:hypothetical protein
MLAKALIALAGLATAAALTVGAGSAADAASYPPATTGTFAVTGHAGANRITIDGLGAKQPATALISGRGAAPTVADFRAGLRAETADLEVGTTDASGAVTFTLVFPREASGVYNVSLSTPDGHSVSGSVTLPAAATGPLALTGSNIAMWIVWLAGILVLIGIIAVLIASARRRTR